VKAVAKYSFFAVILAPLGAAFFSANGIGGHYWEGWRVCFLSEALAFVTLTPAILSWITEGPAWVRKPRACYLEPAALITGLVTTIAWVIATFVTRPESDETLIGFYKRVHPTVYGWRRIAELVPEMPQVRDVAANAFNWVMGVILVYGCLFGIGKIVFGQLGWGLLLLALSGIAGYLIFWDLSRRGWSTFSGKETAVPASVEGD
jgi:TM2 domain-containing membrane protein YozV